MKEERDINSKAYDTSIARTNTLVLMSQMLFSVSLPNMLRPHNLSLHSLPPSKMVMLC